MAKKAPRLALTSLDNLKQLQSDETTKVTKETRIHPKVLVVPDESFCSCYSGLMRCSVVVKDNQYLMYYDGAERPVLRADKQLTLKILPKYYIFDVSQVQQGCTLSLDKDSSQYIGKIRRDKDLNIHAFSLHPKRDTVDSQQSLYVLYNIVPSDWVNILIGDEPPRKAQVALYSNANDTCSQHNTLAETISSCMKDSNSLSSIDHPDAGLHVLTNKKPYKNRHGKHALNFFGRCHRPNAANMQLQDKDGRVILQLAQSKRNTFNLDFRAPFNAFQAFGFAIAQLAEY